MASPIIGRCSCRATASRRTTSCVAGSVASGRPWLSLLWLGVRSPRTNELRSSLSPLSASSRSMTASHLRFPTMSTPLSTREPLRSRGRSPFCTSLHRSDTADLLHQRAEVRSAETICAPAARAKSISAAAARTDPRLQPTGNPVGIAKRLPQIDHGGDLADQLDLEALVGRMQHDALDQPAQDLQRLRPCPGLGQRRLEIGNLAPVEFGEVGMKPRRGR